MSRKQPNPFPKTITQDGVSRGLSKNGLPSSSVKRPSPPPPPPPVSKKG